jgi:endonuclease YncB( thermonuclease family)
MEQPFGFEAKEYIVKALAKKKFQVTLVRVGKYNTALGYIHIDGADLGFKLVGNGLAEVDRGSARVFVDPEVKKKYLGAQEIARNTKTGMWVQGENYEYPLDYLLRTKKKRKQQGH